MRDTGLKKMKSSNKIELVSATEFTILPGQERPRTLDSAGRPPGGVPAERHEVS